MRVLVDTLIGLGRTTGIGRYTAELVAALATELGPGEAVEAFPSGWLRSACSWLWGLAGRGGVPGRGRTWRGWLKERAVGLGRRFLDGRFRAALRRGYDLYHEPNNIPFECDTPTVVTVHDLSVLLYPQWHPAARVARYEQAFRAGLARCVHVLTDTAAVAGEIVAHLGVPADRVTPTLLGVGSEMRPVPAEGVAAMRRRLRLPGEYLLSVGTLEPRKNQLLLARAYVRLPQALRRRYPLVLAGGVGWNTDELLGFLDGQGRDSGLVRAGYVADADLPALYSGARALLFPSFYEGFGLPPLEMQACGGAVVASTASAVAEVLAGSPALLLDPRDEDAWHQALLRLCSDDDFASSLRSGAQQAAARFTWRRCARETLAVYRRVARPGLRRAG